MNVSISLFIFLILLISCSQSTDLPYKPQQSEQENETEWTGKVKVIKDGQWGYDVFRYKKKLIQQYEIPAIKGDLGFQSEEDAEKVLNLVLEKLKKSEFPPSITVQELDSLKINYHYNY